MISNREREKITLRVTTDEKYKMCNALLLLAYQNLSVASASELQAISDGLSRDELILSKLTLRSHLLLIDEYKAAIEQVRDIVDPPKKSKNVKKAKKKTDKKVMTEKKTKKKAAPKKGVSK